MKYLLSILICTTAVISAQDLEEYITENLKEAYVDQAHCEKYLADDSYWHAYIQGRIDTLREIRHDLND
jgi:hypothetical protein